MQLGQTVRGLQDQGNINRLAGQAANSSGMERTSALNQMWGVNPEMAAKQETALGSSEDRRNKGMVQAARMLSGAPESMRPGLYQQMKPMLSQYGLQLPEQYDNTVAEAANALVQAYGGTTGASGVQSTYIDADGNRVAIMRDGSTSILGKNDLGANKQTVTMDINGVPTQVTFDRRTAGYEQATLGGSPQQVQPQQTGTRFTAPNGEVIDVSQIQDPHVRQQIINDPQSWGMVPDGSSANLPPRNVSSMPTPIIGRTAEAEAAAVEQAKLGVELGGITARGSLETDVEAERVDRLEREKLAREREQKAVERAVNAADTLNLLQNAERLLGDATGSGVGAIYDSANAFFGRSTEGRQANAALKTLAGQLTSKMPRMEGPQSDRDVQMYKEMAGDLGNEEIPVQTRLAALAEIRRLNQKYAHLQGPDSTPPQQSTQPQRQGAVQIQNAADYNRLPSGALYITPTGETRRKR
jgi:hypothetical protein